MTTNILFIVPMHNTFDSFINPSKNQRLQKKKDGKYYNLPPTDLPLGFLSISAFLKKHADVNVKLIDFNVLVFEEDEFPYNSFFEYAIKRLNDIDFHPDIVGISGLFSPSYQNFLELGKASKERFPDALVIGGGNIPTSAYNEIYSSKYSDTFDALCFGEGELPMLELVNTDSTFEYLSLSKTWVTKEKIENGFDPEHNFISDLDEIPFYDYDLCDIDKHNANLVVKTAFATTDNLRSFHVVTSRGCPFKCTFCASHAVHGRKMRSHSVERLREDFSLLRYKYKADTLVFQDDHLMDNNNRVYKILDILKELGLNSIYQSGLALYALDRPMLEAFHAAGVRQLVLAVESGSPRVLKYLMKKPLKLEISQRVANDCRDLGIYTNTNILIGMPGETKEDIEEGRKNLAKINSNWFHINCASPLVGSEMHKISKQKGYIKGETLGADYKMAVVETTEFSTDYIQDMQYIMNLELNFVNNNDMKIGDYNIALEGFNGVISVKHDHTFAWYYAAKCHYALGNQSEADHCAEQYKKYSNTKLWKKYIDMFELQPLNSIIDFKNIHCTEGDLQLQL
jgi:radical SAM superfamily enzyme YgiQ (UPF0313 family)